MTYFLKNSERGIGMKFITEIDLRNLYKKQAFTVYNIDENIRLTPGARQFLLDRKIQIMKSEIHEVREESIGLKKKKNWRKMKLLTKLSSLEALFFIIVEETIGRDLILAQEIIKLSKEIRGIKESLENNTPIKDINFDANSKLEEKLSLKNMEVDIDITDFHIQLEKGRDILNLHRLRCGLEEIEPSVYQLWEYDDDKIELYENIIIKLHQLINRLSQEIYYILGGVKC